jgi:hypothetical protein
MSDIDGELKFVEDDQDPSEHYPPVGTPETALVVVIDCDNYCVLAHTGRYFHAQCDCAGFQGEEVGITDVPDGDPGVYVFENGEVWTTTCPDSGCVDDCGIDGDWRLATPEDVVRFGFKANPPFDIGDWGE